MLLIIFFHAYTDETTLLQRILVQVGWSDPSHLYELKRDKNGIYSFYIINYLLGEPHSSRILDLAMTGMNKGATVRFSNITYWQNFNGVIDRSFDRKYLYNNRIYVAVSYDESTFVGRNDNSYYEFYLLDEKNDIKIKQSILISYN